MATKKETAPPIPPLDISNMNVWERLLHVRTEFYEAGVKKSGKNLHAEFEYFELADIVPIAQQLFAKYRLLLQTSFVKDMAYAAVVNIDDPDKSINFSIPLVFISEPSKFRMNEVQGAGAAVTYYRRYLYFLVLDLVQNDEIDSGEHEKKPTTAPGTPPKREPKTPPTPSERKKTAKRLTEEANAPATEEQIAELKAVLKTLLSADPEQEEFIGDIAVRTNKFTKITADQCTALISGVNAMLENYKGSEG